MKKLFGFIKAVLLIIILFFLGFLLFNFAMRLLVDHKHEEKTPDVTGMSFEVARQVCRNNNLYLEEIERVNNDEYAQGKIISQEPHPGILTKRFRTVKVVVSAGPELVKIPFLANLTVNQARLNLENAGLIMGEKQYRYSDVVEKDKLISSSPLAEEELPRGSKVDLIISLGKMQSNDNRYDKYKDLLESDTP
ncbi:MAG: PASTA domain-containing protein [Candidatus Cloacimonetes bacterium]|nr:PASTA domain-containing protein [Candidatus Cloacimonadota bacterium]